MADPVRDAVAPRPWTSPFGILERFFARWFDSLVYNQIWEDPRVDLEALQVNGDSRIVSIASGGCNVLNYLIESPRQIVALDINQYHMYLMRLRLAALRHLPGYLEFFSFFGSANAQSNVEMYNRHVRDHLEPAAREYWEGGSWMRTKVIGPRINYFARNLYDYAKLGYLLRFLHLMCRIARKDPARILRARNRKEQEQLFEENLAPVFDNKLVRLIGRNPLVYFSLGIPPRQVESLRREHSGCIVELYRERVRRLTCEFEVHDNYFAWQALSRSYDLEKRRALPPYLTPEGYANCKRNAARVETTIVNLTEFLRAQPTQSFDRFVLLDSQDWMTPEQIRALWTEIARVGKPGTRVIFRTGASTSPIETALSADLRSRFVYEREQSHKLHRRDRAAIYGGFHLYVMQARHG